MRPVLWIPEIRVTKVVTDFLGEWIFSKKLCQEWYRSSTRQRNTRQTYQFTKLSCHLLHSNTRFIRWLLMSWENTYEEQSENQKSSLWYEWAPSNLNWNLNVTFLFPLCTKCQLPPHATLYWGQPPKFPSGHVPHTSHFRWHQKTDPVPGNSVLGFPRSQLGSYKQEYPAFSHREIKRPTFLPPSFWHYPTSSLSWH